MLDGNSVASNNKEQVSEARIYLAKRLATKVALVDKIIPILAALHNTIPFSEGGWCQGPGRTLLFDIT